jgi:MYXO-CTERM domain-containing protein
VRAVATDADGNSATDASSFVVDTETEVSIDAPANGSTVPGPRPTIVGIAEPGASVVVSIGGTEIGTVTADAAGRWSVRASSDLAPGEHTATAEATDEAGNTASATSTFTVSDVDDTDGDGFPDTEECPSEPCRDTDEDGTPDFQDPDDDGDGIPTAIECPGAASCVDSDEDGTPNYLDPDDDDDGILTRDEGSGTIDTDRDGIPDHLDVDDDGDGLLTEDECSATPCVDTDEDGRPNYVDPDDDGDSIPTTRERADGATHGNDVDDDGDDNWLDTDSDGADAGDTEEGVGDTDGDGVPDYLDPDVVPMPDGGMPDGGVDGGVPSDGGIVDADVPDAISSDAGVDSGTPPTGGGYAGGALCSTTGTSDPSAAFGLAVIGLALAWRRRRR